MNTEESSEERKSLKRKVSYRSGGSGAVYGFGLIGAWIYYLTHATTFWLGMLGLLKGIFWPAFLVFEVMKYLGM